MFSTRSLVCFRLSEAASQLYHPNTPPSSISLILLSAAITRVGVVLEPDPDVQTAQGANISSFILAISADVK